MSPIQTRDLTMDQQTPEFSIVVACRNEAAHITAFLDSLLAQGVRGAKQAAE